MAISTTNLTASSTGADASSFNTASVAPSGVVTLSIYAKRSTGTIAAPTVSGGSGTWVKESETISSTRGSWQYTCKDFSGSGAITIDFGAQTISFIFWSVENSTGVDTSGDVTPQFSAPGTASGTTRTLTFAAFGDATNNAFIVMTFHLANEATTSEHPELSDQNAAYEDSVGFAVQADIGEDTGVVSSWTTSSNNRMHGIELKAAAAGQPTTKRWGGIKHSALRGQGYRQRGRVGVW